MIIREGQKEDHRKGGPSRQKAIGERGIMNLSMIIREGQKEDHRKEGPSRQTATGEGGTIMYIGDSWKGGPSTREAAQSSIREAAPRERHPSQRAIQHEPRKKGGKTMQTTHKPHTHEHAHE